AVALTDAAAALALPPPNRYTHAEILADLARAAATAGDQARASALIGSIDQPERRARAWADAVHALVLADRADVAEAIVRESAHRDAQVEWMTLAEASASAGDHDRAVAAARTAEGVARRAADPESRVEELIDLTTAVSGAGDHRRALALADLGARLARKVASPYQRTVALIKLIPVYAAAGEHRRAVAVADAARPAAQALARAPELRDLAKAVAALGDHDRARAV